MFCQTSHSQSHVRTEGQIVYFCECTILAEHNWQPFNSECILFEFWEVLRGFDMNSNLGIVPTQL